MNFLDNELTWMSARVWNLVHVLIFEAATGFHYRANLLYFNKPFLPVCLWLSPVVLLALQSPSLFQSFLSPVPFDKLPLGPWESKIKIFQTSVTNFIKDWFWLVYFHSAMKHEHNVTWLYDWLSRCREKLQLSALYFVILLVKSKNKNFIKEIKTSSPCIYGLVKTSSKFVRILEQVKIPHCISGFHWFALEFSQISEL